MKFYEALLEMKHAIREDRLQMPSEDRFHYDRMMENKAVELKKAAEADVNSFGYDAEQIANDAINAEKELFAAIIVQWIVFWAGEGSRFSDGRNAIAIQKCQDIRWDDHFRQFAETIDEYSETYRVASLFIANSPFMHKTLMQSFTSVILCGLQTLSGIKTSHRMPLI